MPLQSLLDWLSKPKGPTLVEASVAAASDKALALAVTKRMLYGEKPPLVGVGLVYKLHYISTVPFSAAYMHLNVWNSAGSNEESEDRLNASHLLFVNISEMSNVIPVVVQHPVLLDVASKEAMEGTGEPMSPLSFRGFRLHTIWTQQPRGELAHHIPFPRQEQLISAQIRVREVSPGPEAGPKDSTKPQASCQRPLEHCLRPCPPFDIECIQAAT